MLKNHSHERQWLGHGPAERIPEYTWHFPPCTLTLCRFWAVGSRPVCYQTPPCILLGKRRHAIAESMVAKKNKESSTFDSDQSGYITDFGKVRIDLA